MRRLKWLRLVTVAVIVVSLSAALGFALKRSTGGGDPTNGAPAHGHAAGPEGATAKVEPDHGEGVESEHGDEVESGREDEADPGPAHEGHRH